MQNKKFRENSQDGVFEFAANQKKKDEKQNRIKILADIRAKFSKWRWYIIGCVASYFVLFLISKAIISFVKPYAKQYFVNDWTAIIVWVILGFCFVADSWATSYLKSALQRLSYGIEKSFLVEELKDKLLAATQDINELFKMNFQRFGLAVVPALLIGIVDNGVTEVIDKQGQVIGQVVSPKKRSEGWLFYICYAIPMILAAYKILKMNSILKQIEKDFYSEHDKL
jgi:ABC-type uncharacterized transport system permease subunit